MKNKLFIFGLILIIIIIGGSIKLYIDDVNNNKLKEKYQINNSDENLTFDITMPPGKYNFTECMGFYLTPFEAKYTYMTKKVFLDYSRQIQLNNTNLKYYGCAIHKDGGEYLYTSSLINKLTILEYSIPLSDEDKIFIKKNFLNKENAEFINIFPFKDKQHLLLEEFNQEYIKSNISIVYLANKTIKSLDKYRLLPCTIINAKENVAVLKEKVPSPKTYVINENGEVIAEYR